MEVGSNLIRSFLVLMTIKRSVPLGKSEIPVKGIHIPEMLLSIS
jgi:hypothetical protein